MWPLHSRAKLPRLSTFKACICRSNRWLQWCDVLLYRQCSWFRPDPQIKRLCSIIVMAIRYGWIDLLPLVLPLRRYTTFGMLLEFLPPTMHFRPLLHVFQVHDYKFWNNGWNRTFALWSRHVDHSMKQSKNIDLTDDFINNWGYCITDFKKSTSEQLCNITFVQTELRLQKVDLLFYGNVLMLANWLPHTNTLNFVKPEPSFHIECSLCSFNRNKNLSINKVKILFLLVFLICKYKAYSYFNFLIMSENHNNRIN